MAVGDDAAAAGYPLVPSSAEEGRVHWGYREINRTRDFIAQLGVVVSNLAASIPVGKPAYRNASGIYTGTAAPTGGANGDIYIQLGVGTFVKDGGVWVAAY